MAVLGLITFMAPRIESLLRRSPRRATPAKVRQVFILGPITWVE